MILILHNGGSITFPTHRRFFSGEVVRIRMVPKLLSMRLELRWSSGSSIVRDADRRLFALAGEDWVGVRKEGLRWQRYLADEDWTCARCGGVVLCMPWCESINARVHYAHD